MSALRVSNLVLAASSSDMPWSTCDCMKLPSAASSSVSTSVLIGLHEVLAHVRDDAAHGGRDARIARDDGPGDPDFTEHGTCMQGPAAAKGHEGEMLRVETRARC